MMFESIILMKSFRKSIRSSICNCEFQRVSVYLIIFNGFFPFAICRFLKILLFSLEFNKFTFVLQISKEFLNGSTHIIFCHKLYRMCCTWNVDNKWIFYLKYLSHFKIIRSIIANYCNNNYL